MEFAVPCLINSRDFIQIGISFFLILLTSLKLNIRAKGHQVQFQNHYLSDITNLC